MPSIEIHHEENYGYIFMKIKLKTINLSIFNQLWDKFHFFSIQNERIALMGWWYCPPYAWRLAHLLYDLEIHDKVGGLKEF